MTVHLDVLDNRATVHVLDTSHRNLLQHFGTLASLVRALKRYGVHTDFVLVDSDYDHKYCYTLSWGKDSFARILLKKRSGK